MASVLEKVRRKYYYLKYSLKGTVARYPLPGHFALMPTDVFIYVSYRCNLKCKMCPQYGEAADGVAFKDAEASRNEMSIEDYRRIIGEIRGFRPTLHLSGGEPLLHKDIRGIISVIKENGMPCAMVTNAVLLDKYAGFLVDAGLDSIVVSLDGPENIHDEIRGIPGTFGRAKRGIAEVNRLKRERGKDKPHIAVSTVITPDNIERLPEMIGIGREWGANSVNFAHMTYYEDKLHTAQKKILKRLMPDCGYLKNIGLSYGDLYGEIDVDKLNGIIGEIKRTKGDMKVHFSPLDVGPDELRKYYDSKGIMSLARKYGSCSRFSNSLHIEPDGTVDFCWGHTIGNARCDGVRKIWNNAAARSFRKILHQKRFLPLCVRCCNLYRHTKADGS